MYVLLITVHVMVCVLLILIVLIQQGKGGGLIDTLSSAESIFGTKTNTFLIKSTSVLSVIFFLTCLSLAAMSIQRNKSLIETSYKPPKTTLEGAPTVKVEETNQTVATPLTNTTVPVE